MKIITLAIATLIAAAAQAGTYTYHDYDAALRGIALDNACITATEVRTIAPQRVCAQLNPVVTPGTGGDGNMPTTDWVCARWENTQLAFSRSFEKSVCLVYDTGRGESSSGGCLQTGVEAAFLPATIKVGTYHDVSGERGTDFPGTSSSFTFPSCN